MCPCLCDNNATKPLDLSGKKAFGLSGLDRAEPSDAPHGGFESLHSELILEANGDAMQGPNELLVGAYIFVLGLGLGDDLGESDLE